MKCPSFVPKTGKITKDRDPWARQVAVINLRKPSTETILRRWWVKKYKLPWTHECAQDSTIEDLLIEYYEDYFESFPDELRKERSVDGEFYFEELGDPLLDKWEEELRRGVTPDLEEGLSQEEKSKLRKERDHINQSKKASSKFEEIDEVYGDYQRMKSNKKQLRTVVAGQKEYLRNKSSNGQILGSGPIVDSNDVWEDLLGTD